MSAAHLLVLCVVVPLAGAALVVAVRRRPNLREACTLATAAVVFTIVLAIHGAVDAGGRPRIELFDVVPGLSLAFEAEPLGVLFALVASFLWIVTSIYSIGYMRGHHEKNQTRFYAFFAIAIGSALGIAFAANMFTLFLFYEALTLCTYPLVTHAGTEEARRGGRLYLGLLLGTSIGFQLVAVIWTWAVAGTLDFTPGGIFPPGVSDGLIGVLFALYVFGIGKAALMPFHRWLPAAMVAPTPVSALLHAVAVVKAGVFSILKVAIYLFGIERLADTGAGTWIAYVAGATIVIGSLVAMTRDNLKARLAYSTISQLSYVILGAVLASSWGVIGGGLQIVMHAFGKITLFFCAGAIMVASHKTEVSEMRGLGRQMPLTMAAFLVGSLSIIGVPLVGGMWSKWYLLLATLDAGQAALLVVLLLSSLLNIAYLLPIPVRAFLAPRGGGEPAGGIKEAPIPCLIAIGVTTVGCVALFFNPDPFHALMTQALSGPPPP